MPASRATVEQIAAVLCAHMTLEKARSLVGELMVVPGNRSFQETMARLAEELRAREARRGGHEAHGGSHFHFICSCGFRGPC